MSYDQYCNLLRPLTKILLLLVPYEWPIVLGYLAFQVGALEGTQMKYRAPISRIVVLAFCRYLALNIQDTSTMRSHPVILGSSNSEVL